jgi:hypothetical protein
VSIVLKSGSLKLLEPSGPIKGCNGIALIIDYHQVEKDFVNTLYILQGNELLVV